MNYIQSMSSLSLVCLYKMFSIENIRSLKLHIKCPQSNYSKKKKRKTI